MSTGLRIASVTQVLKNLLILGLSENSVSDFIGGTINVTSWSPDRLETGIDKEASQLNVFMYQATYNQGWRNASQPAFNSQGDRIANPPLALDLHYLLSAYGSSELHTDILLGFGMQFLHEKSVLDKKTIRRIIDDSAGQPGGSLLVDSELIDQTEQLTLTPELLSIEDISKLWAAFGAKYRPTAAYRVTVVLIESRKSIKPGLPVQQRKIYVNPFREPVIEEVASQLTTTSAILKNQKILSGQRLVLVGKQLKHESVQILIDGGAVDGAAGHLKVSNEQIAFDLLPEIGAGKHQVQVTHQMLMGSPLVPRTVAVSMPASFVLSPQVVSQSVSNATTAAGLVTADIDLELDPALNPGQEVILLLTELTSATNRHSYSFPLPAVALQSPQGPTKNITININGVAPGTYLVRIRVDGADSPLKTDPQGNYNSPAITL